MKSAPKLETAMAEGETAIQTSPYVLSCTL